jgi:sigma-B regulation protein RsbU (phosphoserine phosphatase)
LITDKKRALNVTIFWVVVSFFTAHLCFWILPDTFESLNKQTFDRLFLLRSNSNLFQPQYDDTIVHIDLNNTTIRKLDNFYLSRSFHAQVVRNLSAMKVSAQLYDFIFASRTNPVDDNRLIEAFAQSNNTYIGMAFQLLQSDPTGPTGTQQAGVEAYLDKTKWKVRVQGDPHRIYIGGNPLITFSDLADAARGLGFLSIINDSDGIFRRMPLLVRYQDAYYPSFSFRAICDHLNVSPESISVIPGKSITLKDARRPGETKAHDIVIPIDRHGNMAVNFIGPWGRMKHYNFYDVLKASRDRDEMSLWEEELSGKIVVISDVTTGTADIGPVPTDTNFPLSGLHANALHTILTESFLTELSNFQMVFVETFLLLMILILSLRLSAFSFSAGSLIVAAGYTGVAAVLFLSSNIVLQIVRPVMMIGISLISIHVASAIENTRFFAKIEKEKEVAERDLEIGRQIQAGFFPEKIPAVDGWEIAAFFKPARQVAGDFYDVFELRKTGKVAFVIADVCDKGVGAALFMALFRTLIRAFALSNDMEIGEEGNPSQTKTEELLENTITRTNNYIADIHSQADMFATLFFGVLDPTTGLMHYINCGHEPPLVIAQGSIKAQLGKSGPAAGIFPDLNFSTRRFQFDPGDTLFAFTDGVIEAQNPSGEFFNQDTLSALLTNPFSSSQALIDCIQNQIFEHIADTAQFDDLTMIAVQRKTI